MAAPISSIHTELQPNYWTSSERSDLKWSRKKRMTNFSIGLVASPIISVVGACVLSCLIFKYATHRPDDRGSRRCERLRIKHMGKLAIPLYNAYYLTRGLEEEDISDGEYGYYPNGENIGNQLE